VRWIGGVARSTGDLEEANAGVKMKAAAEGEVPVVDSRKALFIRCALVRQCSLSFLLLCEDPAKNLTIIVGD
jgi:hypothetical protein